MTGTHTEYDYYCRNCEESKEVKQLFSEFHCGEDPDTSVETELTVKATEKLDSHDRGYWFTVVDGPRSGFQHGMRIKDGIDISVGSYYEVTVRSLNDKRTLWKVISATELE